MILNKNVHLIALIVLMAGVFTGVIFILFQFNLLVGSLATLLLFVMLTIILFKGMIEQKYDLLSDLPAQGQTVNPFRLIVFGKAIWQYPPEGPFIFDFDGGLEKERGSSSTPEALSSPGKGLPVEDGYDMEVRIFPRSNRGRKSDRTEEEWDAFAKEYLAPGNYEKQAAFCQRHHIGSPRTFRNHVRKYKIKNGIK